MRKIITLFMPKPKQVEPTTDWEAKFKKAVTDLEKRDLEVEDLKVLLGRADAERDGFMMQADDLRPDARKWRDYLKRSRDRKRGKAS